MKIVITYPRPLDPLGNIVEVKGTADDGSITNSVMEIIMTTNLAPA